MHVVTTKPFAQAYAWDTWAATPPKNGGSFVANANRSHYHTHPMPHRFAPSPRTPSMRHASPHPHAARLLGSALLLLLAASPARPAPPPMSLPVLADDAPPTGEGLWDFLDNTRRSAALLGDMWGLRSELSRHGISLGLQETSELLCNAKGGLSKGCSADGLTQMDLALDTQRAWGHYGGEINLSVLNIHGRNLSADKLGSLQTASGIEADVGTRLWELWVDQKFLEEDRLDLKLGQQSLDQEFMVSPNALVFVNTMFGWPMLPSADMPAGGPAYPLSALGARLSARPIDGVQVLAGVFNASPLRHDDGRDPQLQDAHGTEFALGGGTLSIVEFQFSYPALGSMVMPGESQPLGWTYRVGAWYDTQSFDDQRLAANGLSQADPSAAATPQQHRGNYAFYAVADRLLWRDGRDPNRSLAVFARAMGTPLHDRNLIDSSLNLGVVMHSPLRYRAEDVLALGMGVAHVSKQALSLANDQLAQGQAPSGPTLHQETFVELSYQYQLRPWVWLQPDVQYVFNPGAGAVDPRAPNRLLGNEWVMGVRANVSF